MKAAVDWLTWSRLAVVENTVSTRRREILAFPIMWRLMEYRAIMVRMPARMAGIFNFV